MRGPQAFPPSLLIDDKLEERLARKLGWSEERIADALANYRNFLWLSSLDQSQHHAPSEDVDEVWHAHILHTHDYIAFCDEYFGRYFHHVPGD